jgi:hypothetical protein
MVGQLARIVVRAVYYCQKCAGQATYPGTCCGLPMVAG